MKAVALTFTLVASLVVAGAVAGGAVASDGTAAMPQDDDTTVVPDENNTTQTDDGTLVDIDENESVSVGNETDIGSALVDVLVCADARLTVANKTVDASVLSVTDVNLSEGGFIVVKDQTGAVVGHSGHLEPGTVDEVPVQLSADLTALAGVTVTAYEDTNDDGVFNGSLDQPYCDDGQDEAPDDGDDDQNDGDQNDDDQNNDDQNDDEDQDCP
jgi:hypothetical protein